jgi:thioredoxin-dependent adenylylsulfate APS reductase
MNETATDVVEYTGSREPQAVIGWAIEKFHPRIAIACSFQHTALIHMALQVSPDIRVFSIDTGRLPEETYECADDIEKQLGVKIEWYFPKQPAVEKLMREGGPYSFRKSLDARQTCCGVRKVEPLNRALSGLDAWMSGVRRDQSATRNDAKMIQVDEAHGGILKVNPLADWTYEEVTAYVKKNKLPYNRLFEKGYTSVGCACCTRPSGESSDPRSGRWWWEQSEHKECGLHPRNWSI